MSQVLSYEPPPAIAGRIYRGWLNLIIAALAMVATLPGRTQGLGLITEPLLRDLRVSHLHYATLNGWATLIGSTFCLGCGPLIDRFGVRSVLTAVLVALAGSVLAMSRISGSIGLLVTLILTRGFGQSALSVVSLTIVGKWFVRRLPIAMAVYSILISLGFIVGFTLVGYEAIHAGWRPVWSALAIATTALAILGLFLVRRSPESIGIEVDGGPAPVVSDTDRPETGFTLGGALRTPAFWAFALSGAVFALVSTGLMLFNEAVLTERGFPREMMLTVIAIVTLMGLIANFLGGWLAERWPIGRLMGAAMFFLAASLCVLPLARSTVMVYAYAISIGIAGGIVMVIFFVCWGKVFGRKHLGAIQGAAQILTVFGSAAGPVALQLSIRLTGSSAPLLFSLSPLVVVMGLFCWFVPSPTYPRTTG